MGVRRDRGKESGRKEGRYQSCRYRDLVIENGSLREFSVQEEGVAHVKQKGGRCGESKALVGKRLWLCRR